MRWWTWALLGAAVVLIWLLTQLAEARLLLLALFAAVITTISATQAWREIGFTSGALVTALTAFQTTFPMDARATFYQSVATRIDSVVAQELLRLLRRRSPTRRRLPPRRLRRRRAPRRR